MNAGQHSVSSQLSGRGVSEQVSARSMLVALAGYLVCSVFIQRRYVHIVTRSISPPSARLSWQARAAVLACVSLSTLYRGRTTPRRLQVPSRPINKVSSWWEKSRAQVPERLEPGSPVSHRGVTTATLERQLRRSPCLYAPRACIVWVSK